MFAACACADLISLQRAHPHGASPFTVLDSRFKRTVGQTELIQMGEGTMGGHRWEGGQEGLPSVSLSSLPRRRLDGASPPGRPSTVPTLSSRGAGIPGDLPRLRGISR
eukprot:7387636-Prymnesium_polylepis.2